MYRMCIVFLTATIAVQSARANIYSADLRQALCYVLSESNEHTLIICNTDIPDAAHMYDQSETDIEKEIKSALKSRRKDTDELLATVKKLMQAINPTYVAMAKLLPNVIGITRRSLRWAHLLNQACEQEEIYNQPKRLAIVVPANEQINEPARETECNTGIIYLDRAQPAEAIYHYINMWHPECTRIILIDTDEATLRAWMSGLAELQAPPVTAILVHC